MISNNNIISAYSGYNFTIPDKIKVGFYSSFNSDNNHNYPCTYSVKVGDFEASLSQEDIDCLISALEKMSDISARIPTKDNPSGYIEFRR